MRLLAAPPALQEQTLAGKLTYSPIWDTHLNELGARAVARVLAEKIGSHGRIEVIR